MGGVRTSEEKGGALMGQEWSPWAQRWSSWCSSGVRTGVSPALPVVHHPRGLPSSPEPLETSPSALLDTACFSLIRRTFQGLQVRGDWGLLIKHPALDSGSDHDLTVRGIKPHSCADNAEPAWDCLSLPLRPPLKIHV